MERNVNELEKEFYAKFGLGKSGDYKFSPHIKGHQVFNWFRERMRSWELCKCKEPLPGIFGYCEICKKPLK